MQRKQRSGLVALVTTVAAFIGLAAALTVPSATALAAPSSRQFIEIEDVSCAHLVNGDAQAYLQAFDHSVHGPIGGLQLWIEPDDIIVDPPTFVSGAADLSVGEGDSGFFGTFEIVTPDDQRVVGIGTIEAYYTPDGPVHVGGAPKSTGNERFREQVITQPMAVTGTLTLDLTAMERQIVFSLDDCLGATVDVHHFENDPASSVTSFEITVLSCVITTDDIHVQLSASDDLGLVSVEGVVQTATGNYPVTATEGLTFTLSEFGVSVPLVAASGGGEGLEGAPEGTLTATAALAKQPKVAWTDEIDGTSWRYVQQNLAVSGAVVIAFDDGTTFDLPLSDETCDAFDYSARSVTNR